MIIGITGTLGAGKTEVAKLLSEKGFNHFSVREFLYEELDKRDLDHTRDNLVNVANKLRERNSPSYIIEQIFESAQEKGGNSLIESVRTIGEIEVLRKKGKFVLIAVDADPRIRYERIFIRGEKSDKISFEEFMADEQREMTSNNPYKQNLRACINEADVKIINNGSIEELKKDVLEIIKKFGVEDQDVKKVKEIHERLSWDEYFMEIAKTVAMRATCDRGRSGCVIARDKRILVTGYVGSPIGLPHCDEVGHQMKTLTHEDGNQSNHCVRTTHAEQNAICQAAKLGISIDGATLYCKMTPCSTCAKMIINTGIKKVVAEKKYHAGKETEEMFKQAGIELEIFNEEVEKYEDQ